MTNHELREAIEKLCEELGVELDIDLERMGKSSLEIALQELRGRAGAPTPEPTLQTVSYCVAPGKALTSRRGMLAPGDCVSASDLSGGEQALRELVAKGYLVNGSA